jgi:L-amino acid N-acyltransferase YncA
MREKLAYRHVLHLSIFVSRENKGSTIGKASEQAMGRERNREKDSTELQPTARAHHHIIQFASISTRSSNSSSFNNRNELD